ncbi:uncharacterized protein RHIMIDRAFT_252124 [Rhizopus microsporus ATCC 52813]|uniref:Uncharacterized protein n=1 Tax=Rhizopus microsporus ATCC 52813 TaxID=1340429 RepID=A0A2G4SG68_RHIZD|nr:uncharacterized protein RHIMIDRAFT_273735 [Rhizopus microsporus ATCC 52813]XP_023470551.1 uncharacterized protein RHIMIDRAFT_252124 [Rhizopus microsporus ATCC 52813]PHZ07755.1 hypothetical protein RHIMIDRAFT_273735 [Rhizopus microsporus ATCC 52813]PHZ16843.1 hypothetical protein RHIMIDRAFT_252124 [Rhizopus microsporus ATCC 52813]
MALNIFVSFADKQVHRVQLVPEKLTWDNLVTILQLSIPQAPPNTNSLVLYYRHPVTNATATVSNQTELSHLMDEVKTPYDGLRFSSVPEAAEPLLVSCGFEKLASLVKQHQPLDHFASRWVGVLATYMAMSPEENFDRELKKLAKMVTGGKKCKGMRVHRLGRRHRHSHRHHRRHGQRSEVEEEEEAPIAEKEDNLPFEGSSSSSSSSDDSSEDEFAQDKGHSHRHHPHHHFKGDRFGHHGSPFFDPAGHFGHRRGPFSGPDACFGRHQGPFPGPHSRFGPFEDPQSFAHGFDPKKRMKLMKKFMKHYHHHGHHHGPQGHGPQFFFA